MVDERSCAPDAIELCLDAQITAGQLRFLQNSPQISDPIIERTIQTAKDGWAAVKRGLSNLERCGISLVNDQAVADIEATFSSLRVDQRFLDTDAPFLANRIQRLMRFEVLTSGGRPARE